MWQNQTVQDKRELLTLMGACATSQHVSAQVINAAGTGYVVGEIITLTHAGAFANATFEVLTIGGGGSVSTLVRRNWGAFSNRLATVAVNAGGTGYSVGEIVEVQGGTERQMGKARVDTEAAGVVTAVSVFETGGAYSVAPGLTGATTLGIGPSTFGGNDDLTLNLTMTGLISLTGNATTASAAGTGLTLDITLTQTGWFTGSQNLFQDTNDFSLNSINDQKQLALKGTVTGGDEPFIMFRTGTATVGIDDNHFIIWSACDAFNPAVDFNSQTGNMQSMTGIGVGHYTPLFDAQTQDAWISITERKIAIAIKTQGLVTLAYQSGYVGLGNSFATTVNNPYPLVAYACCGFSTVFPDDVEITGPVEAQTHSVFDDPYSLRRQEDAVVLGFRNADPFGVLKEERTVYPGGQNRRLAGASDASTIVGEGRRRFFDIILPSGAGATSVILPTPDSGGDLLPPIPVVLMETNTVSEPINPFDKLRTEIENMYWVTGLDSTGSAITAEDTTTDQNGTRYRIFRSGSRTEVYSLWAMKEE